LPRPGITISLAKTLQYLMLFLGLRPVLTCFNENNLAITLYGDVFDLEEYNFDNEIVECCVRGAWILYEHYNYNDRVEKVTNV